MAGIEHYSYAPIPTMQWIVGRVYFAQTGNLHLMENRRGIAGNRDCIMAQEETEGSLRNHWRREVLIL